MSKLVLTAQILKSLLLLILAASVVGFISFGNFYGIFLASVTALIAFGAYKNNKYGYFAAAAWGLACFQLAKQGYEFQSVKHYVMMTGVCVIPVALFLHEILAKGNGKNARKSVTNESDSRNMPH